MRKCNTLSSLASIHLLRYLMIVGIDTSVFAQA